MKKLQTIILFIATLLSVACASPDELDIIQSSPEDKPAEPASEEVVDTIPTATEIIDTMSLAIIPEIRFEGDEDIMQSRSVIEFDYLASPKVMKFSWDFESDKIGVFPIQNGEGDNQVDYVIKKIENTSNASDARGTFGVNDEGVAAKFAGTYASYFPYKSFVGLTQVFTTKNVPISYLGQVQSTNVDIKTYYQIKSVADKTTDTYKALYNTYLASEKAANAHLGAYDYLISKATATETGSLHFNFTRKGSVVRFFLQAPTGSDNQTAKPLVFDEIQLVNNSVFFTKEATMNIANNEEALTQTQSGHSLSLHLGEYNSSNDSYSGFDFINKTNNNSYRDEKRGYIIAYMFLAPIDLTGAEVEKCFLYLLGRDNEGHRSYYKSSGLTKLNIQANYFYQWSSTVNPDEPITFSEVTFQEFQEDTGYTNDTDGKGTQNW